MLADHNVHARSMQHVLECENCFRHVSQLILAELAANAGSTKSAKKAKAARKNGRLGGRPKKK